MRFRVTLMEVSKDGSATPTKHEIHASSHVEAITETLESVADENLPAGVTLVAYAEVAPDEVPPAETNRMTFIKASPADGGGWRTIFQQRDRPAWPEEAAFLEACEEFPSGSVISIKRRDESREPEAELRSPADLAAAKRSLRQRTRQLRQKKGVPPPTQAQAPDSTGEAEPEKDSAAPDGAQGDDPC